MIYKIISDGGYPNNGSIYRLEKKVEELLSEGFRPIGGIISFQENTSGGIHTIYLQAIVKPQTLLEKIFN